MSVRVRASRQRTLGVRLDRERVRSIIAGSLMRLHYHPYSHNSRRALAVIHHLGLTVELVTVDVLKGAHKSPEYLRLNPNGMVPTLEDGSFILWESNAIMQYLSERAGETSLWPRDPQVRADIARWQFWQVGHFNIAIETLN